MNCKRDTEQENVDYENVSRWPVLVTLLAILIVPFQNTIRVFSLTYLCLSVKVLPLLGNVCAV